MQGKRGGEYVPKLGQLPVRAMFCDKPVLVIDGAGLTVSRTSTITWSGLAAKVTVREVMFVA